MVAFPTLPSFLSGVVVGNGVGFVEMSAPGAEDEGVGLGFLREVALSLKSTTKFGWEYKSANGKKGVKNVARTGGCPFQQCNIDGRPSNHPYPDRQYH
jgi:hypothetical protein